MVDLTWCYEYDEAVRVGTAIHKRLAVQKTIEKRRRVLTQIDEAHIDQKMPAIPKYVHVKKPRKPVKSLFLSILP